MRKQFFSLCLVTFSLFFVTSSCIDEEKLKKEKEAKEKWEREERGWAKRNCTLAVHILLEKEYGNFLKTLPDSLFLNGEMNFDNPRDTIFEGDNLKNRIMYGKVKGEKDSVKESFHEFYVEDCQPSSEGEILISYTRKELLKRRQQFIDR